MTFTRYNANWNVQEYQDNPLGLELMCIKKGGAWKAKDGTECGLGLFEHFKNARKLLWPDRYWHRWTELIYRQYHINIMTILMGPGSCVAGHTRLLNPITGVQTPIEELCGMSIRPMVMTLNGPELANVPFVRGFAGLIEVTLANGRKFTATAKHRVLTEGGFSTVESLSVGERLLSYADDLPQSISGTSQSMSISGARRLWKTVEDFQSDCPNNSRLCGEPTLVTANCDRDDSPLQGDARTSLFHSKDSPLDVREHSQPHNPSGQCVSRLSSLDAFPPDSHKETFSQLHSFSKTKLRGDGSFERPLQSGSVMTHLEPSSEPVPCFSDNWKSSEMPCVEYRVQALPIASIKRLEDDFYYDLEVPVAHHYFAEGTIHHNSQKTSGGSECVFIDWLANPQNTLVIVSTTTVDKLNSAVFGEIKMLHEQALERHPWIPGQVIESKNAITTDDLRDKDTRDMRKGIVGKACFTGSRYVGLGVLSGIKQKRIRFLADELQFMSPTFFDCLPNMFQSADIDALTGDPDVKVVGSGNPKHDPNDMLSKAAEPKNGWMSLGDITKTTVWPTQFHRGACVNLIGTDSPNFDVPEGVMPPYRRLISRQSMKLVEAKWGKNSMQYYSQCVGKMMMNMVGNRVITKDLCDQHHAFETVIWLNDKQTRIGFLDPAWGGASADRCMWGWLEFGIDVTGREIIRFGEDIVVPFAPNSVIPPDDQIAQFVQLQARKNSIEVENIFYDSTGRGTIGAAFARVFGFVVPVPIAFGDKPTARPVRSDLFVQEANGTKRLKRCDEEYRKFVTELWFCARNIIECDQMRELPEEVAQEGYAREYALAPGGKIEVETKDETRERMGMSPDRFDAFVCGLEGARQRGFTIGRLGEDVLIENQKEEDWFEKEAKDYETAIKKGLLQHQ